MNALGGLYEWVFVFLVAAHKGLSSLSAARVSERERSTQGLVFLVCCRTFQPSTVSIRQHNSAYVSIRVKDEERLWHVET